MKLRREGKREGGQILRNSFCFGAVVCVNGEGIGGGNRY